MLYTPEYSVSGHIDALHHDINSLSRLRNARVPDICVDFMVILTISNVVMCSDQWINSVIHQYFILLNFHFYISQNYLQFDTVNALVISMVNPSCTYGLHIFLQISRAPIKLCSRPIISHKRYCYVPKGWGLHQTTQWRVSLTLKLMEHDVKLIPNGQCLSGVVTSCWKIN